MIPLLSSDTKVCTRCKEELPKTSFGAHSGRPAGQLNSWCLNCRRIQSKARRDAQTKDERRREVRRDHLRKYGMTESGYDQLLEEQGGACAICKQTEPGGPGGRLHIDHCHTTNTVRGLLCYHCNVALGNFMDDAALLKQAIQYLDNFSAKRV